MTKEERERARARDRERYAARRAADVNGARPRRRGLRGCALGHVDSFVEQDIVPERHTVPPMDYECPFCRAMDWSPKYPRETTRCCRNGMIRRPDFDILANIRTLFTDRRQFLPSIRRYNTVFQFTSCGSNVDVENASETRGVYTYRVHGRIHHLMGTLLSADDERRPLFAQIYVYDGDMTNQASARVDMHPEFNFHAESVRTLQAFMAVENPYAQAFLTAGEFLRLDPSRELRLVLHELRNTDLRTNNLPTVNEVTAIVVDDEYMGSGRDIIVRTRPDVDPDLGIVRGTGLRRISEFCSMYDPLHYPLIYMRGENGWTYVDRDSDDTNNHSLTCRQWYRYQIFTQDGKYNHLHACGRLFQEWLVDQLAKALCNDV